MTWNDHQQEEFWREIRHQLRRLDDIGGDPAIDPLTASQFAVGRAAQLIAFLAASDPVDSKAYRSPKRALLLLSAALGELKDGQLPPMFDVPRTKARPRLTSGETTIRGMGAAAVDRLKELGIKEGEAIKEISDLMVSAVWGEREPTAGAVSTGIKRALKDHGRHDDRRITDKLLNGEELSSVDEQPHALAVERGLWFEIFADRDRARVLDIVKERACALRGHLPKRKPSDEEG